MIRRRYKVSGMKCGGCASKVEQAANRAQGVLRASVNLADGSVVVEGEADASVVIASIQRAGYRAEVDE